MIKIQAVLLTQSADYEKQKFTLKIVTSVVSLLLLEFVFMHAGLLASTKKKEKPQTVFNTWPGTVHHCVCD